MQLHKTEVSEQCVFVNNILYSLIVHFDDGIDFSLQKNGECLRICSVLVKHNGRSGLVRSAQPLKETALLLPQFIHLNPGCNAFVKFK